LQSGLGGKFDAVPEMLRAHNLLQPVGGMDQIAKGIERQLRPEQIAHNMEVREIRQDDNGVRIVCKNTGTGETFTETGDYCFATIPPTILSTIPGDWSTDIQKALETPRGVPVGKLAVQMNRRFWEEDDGIFGGYSHVDFTGVDKIFYPSYGLLGKKGVVQCYYNYRSTAIKMSNRSLEAKVKFALDNGEKVHPGLFRKHYDNKAFSVDWHLQKYSLGGWDAWTMQEREEHFPKLLEPQGRIVFAGNYLSNFGAWQAGAVESSWQQLEKLHACAMTEH
jgi:monoamine oxidase